MSKQVLSVEQHLVRLQQQVRLCWLLVAVVIGAGCFMAAVESDVQETVKCHTLQIMDDDGQVSSVLAAGRMTFTNPKDDSQKFMLEFTEDAGTAIILADRHKMLWLQTGSTSNIALIDLQAKRKLFGAP